MFGFTLAEAFTELNADTGELYRVQYLERQRFEPHPDLAGTPYEVLIGRLGVAAAERRGLLGTEAFRRLPAASMSTAAPYSRRPATHSAAAS